LLGFVLCETVSDIVVGVGSGLLGILGKTVVDGLVGIISETVVGFSFVGTVCDTGVGVGTGIEGTVEESGSRWL
jgi:hypothetical protein